MTTLPIEISLDQLLNGGNGFFSESPGPITPSNTNTATKSNTGKLTTCDVAAAKTLESYHSQNIQKIHDERSQLPHLRKELAQKREEFERLEHAFSGPSIINNPQDLVALTGRNRLEKEIQAIEERIGSIERGETEAEYFLRVGDILFSYMDAQDQIASGQRVVENTVTKKSRMPSNSVYAYFASMESDKGQKAYMNINMIHPHHIETAPTLPKRASDIVSDIGFRRDKALETYLSALDPNNVHHDAAILSTLEEGFGSCPVCDTEMLFNETFLDCSECGYREYILIDSEKPSYKDPPREMSYYAYKKINHLNEWLAQFQAKESTEIPAAVLDQIKTELRKERITDMGKLKVSKLKEVLKKLKLSRCYDHVAHILNRLNGISAPVLSREVEEKLRFMFKEIQFSFVKHCPKKRSNFLSYSFVLYKFCELLELDEYLQCFPLLKSREKLYTQDKIWELICKDLGWEFIRTV